MIRNEGGVELFPSVARAVAQAYASALQHNPHFRGGAVVINVSAVTASPSVIPKIQGYDPISATYYDILTGAAITGTGQTVLKVYPGLTVAANVAVSDFLPAQWRLIMTHGDTDSITYTASFLGEL